MALKGEFTPTGDKLISHRYLLLSILAKGEGLVRGLSDCEDVLTGIKIFKQLGGEIKETTAGYTVKGMHSQLNGQSFNINCENSATLMRLLTGLLAGIKGEYILDGDVLLKNRPLGRLIDPLRKFGAELETEKLGKLPLKLKGSSNLKGIEYKIQDSNIYVKSALIMAALSAEGTSIIEEDTYTCNHTEILAKIFGAKIKKEKHILEIQKKELTMPAEFVIPSDSSAASYFLIAASFIPNSSVTAKNILLSSERINYLNILSKMGATIEVKALKDYPDLIGNITVKYENPLKAIVVQPEETKLLTEQLPMLALAGGFAKGETVFMNVGELRNKKTDRLKILTEQLPLLGIDIKLEKDNLIVNGTAKLQSCHILNCYSDPTMAMLLKLALIAKNPDSFHKDNVVNMDAVSISYPSFLHDLKSLINN